MGTVSEFDFHPGKITYSEQCVRFVRLMDWENALYKEYSRYLLLLKSVSWRTEVFFIKIRYGFF